ncbi:MFS transporter [Actinoplanes philippinensis]|uniref:Predicted arabinose efflux permease, MFS family n=1 Tax=Actinoplanes philippinensis TaxID=35752 RepID=A0A1I2ADB9_9ACTN|nr:MFS transporter [Actinoplanes philippinensis]GIE74951.1 MFS transporter [Actinoplanes philippinensis]SFE41727.1 Predicted arabinose efflux permease, MFS family [Actinoplanes philippinensis]
MTEAAAQGQTLRQLGPTVYLPSAVYSTGIGAVAPVIVLTATGLGASPAAAAVVAGLLGLGQISGSLPAGMLISRAGERRTMLTASAFAVPALLACMFAPSILLLGAAVALLGVCGSAWSLSRHAYLTEAVRPELRARAMSTLGGVGRIGTFTGPFLGAAAMHAAGLDGAYLVAIAGVGLATAVLIFLPPVPHDRAVPPGAERPTLRQVLRANQRTLRTLGLAVLLVGALRASRQTILPLWGVALDLSPATIGLIYGVSGGIDMLLFYPAGKLMDRYGRRAAAVPAMALLGIAHALLPLAGGVTGLTAVALLMGVGNGLSAGLVMTLGADASPSAGRAEFLGAWRLCSDVGQGGGPLLIGAITAAASLATAAVTVGGSGLLAAYLLHRWIKPMRGTADPAPPSHPVR